MATVPGGSEPVPDLPSSGEPGSTRARRRAHVRPRVGPADPRLVVSAFAGAVVMCSAAVLGAAPVPYAALSPGPVSNVLGSTGDTPMIDVSGRQTYPTNGELDLLTASVRGGPNNSLSMAEVVSGWVDRSVVVRPVQEIYPADLTSEQISERNTAQMESSQESATAAALHELGIEVPTRLTIDRFVDTGQAEGPLREGDRIVAVGGTEVASMAVLREQVQQVEPGGSASVTVIRAGRRVQEPVPRRSQGPAPSLPTGRSAPSGRSARSWSRPTTEGPNCSWSRPAIAPRWRATRRTGCAWSRSRRCPMRCARCRRSPPTRTPHCPRARDRLARLLRLARVPVLQCGS